MVWTGWICFLCFSYRWFKWSFFIFSTFFYFHFYSIYWQAVEKATSALTKSCFPCLLCYSYIFISGFECFTL